MSLTVGELNATLSVDDRSVDPALRRAEQALRQAGQRMGDDADRAGQAAGQQLGQGLIRGADGQWRNMSGELVDAVTAAAAEAEARAHRAGRQIGDGVTDGLGDLQGDARQAGQQAGDGLGEGLADGADAGVAEAGTRLDRLKQIAGMAAAAAGAAAGALLVASMTEALDPGRITPRLGGQLDLAAADAKRYGKIAGQLFTDAIVDDFQAGADTIRAIASAGLVPPGATNAQIKSIATNAADLADLLGVDVSQAANAAGTMIRNGLVKNSKQAFDLLVKGSRGLGAASEDLLETFTEYGPVFKTAGLSGQTAMGLIRQAVTKGWGKDTDKIADAFKELNLRVTSGAKASSDALKSLGLDSQKLADDMSAGGTRGEKAMDTVLDAIRKVGPDSQTAKIAVQDLFGGPGEDLGAALFALDVDKASQSMGGAIGAADKLGNAMRDSAGTKVTKFQRRIQQGVVDFLGTKVIPGMETFRSYVSTKFASVWDEAGADGEQGADRIAGVALLIAQKLGEKFVEAAPKIISAVTGFGGKIAEYVMKDPVGTFKIVAIAGAFLTALVALPALVAAGISALAISLMVGFVGKLISATKSNVPKWWASFTGWVSQKAGEAGTWLAVLGTAIGQWFGNLWSKYVTQPVSRTWNSWLGSVRALPGRTTGALSSMGSSLATSASNAWQRFKDASVRKTGEVISYIRSIPGQARSELGDLGGYLYNAGLSLIGGFIRGIQAKIGDVRNAASSVLSAARDFFPHSPAKRGPFSGRGYTLYSGHALIDAFGKGIADRVPFVRRQMQGLTGDLSGVVAGEVAVRPSMASLASTPAPKEFPFANARSRAVEAPARRVVNNTTSHTYNLTHREMTLRDLEVLQRRQDARARVGRPR